MVNSCRTIAPIGHKNFERGDTSDSYSTVYMYREKSTNYFPIELYTNFQSYQYFTMAISDQSLTSNETLFLALTKNAYKNVGPHGHPDLNGSYLQLLAIRSKSHPHQNSNPLLQSPPVLSLLIFPHLIVYFKQQYFYF